MCVIIEHRNLNCANPVKEKVCFMLNVALYGITMQQKKTQTALDSLSQLELSRWPAEDDQ